MDLNKIYKLKYWQVGIFKLATVSFGIIIGLNFRDFFSNYVTLLWVLFLVPGAYLGYLWYQQK